MKKYRQKQITKDVTILDKTICDMCKKEINGGDWADGMYDIDETNISYRTGKNYPEGGFGEKYRIDLCPECFKNKLIPFIEEEGNTNIESEEWDY